jgi:hypothetical protein
VPKFDLILHPGEQPPGEFAAILASRLSADYRKKLLRHGGLVRLSVASPYLERKGGAKGKLSVTMDFIHSIEQRAREGNLARKDLENLSVKQLLEICRYLKLPIRSAASSREIRDSLLQQLQSGLIWGKIAQIAKGDGDDFAPKFEEKTYMVNEP